MMDKCVRKREFLLVSANLGSPDRAIDLVLTALANEHDEVLTASSASLKHAC